MSPGVQTELYMLCRSDPAGQNMHSPPGKTLASLKSTNAPQETLRHGSVNTEVCVCVVCVKMWKQAVRVKSGPTDMGSKASSHTYEITHLM